MDRDWLFGWVATLLVAGVLACGTSDGDVSAQTAPDVPPAATGADGWRSLFDGKTTTGWRDFHGTKVSSGWAVVDGALTRVGNAPDIITIDQFDNFELTLEWQISEGGNSGILFRVSEDADETYYTGPEMQILDNARHKDGQNPLTSAGSDYALYAPTRDATVPVGGWNTVRLLVDGNHVEHWLNGEKVVEYELGSADWVQRVEASKFKQWPTYGRIPKGHIALQSHGSRVAFRNIRIRTISR